MSNHTWLNLYFVHLFHCDSLLCVSDVGHAHIYVFAFTCVCSRKLIPDVNVQFLTPSLPTLFSLTFKLGLNIAVILDSLKAPRTCLYHLPSFRIISMCFCACFT